MINLSPSKKKFFKIDSESKQQIELTNVSEQNSVLFASISPFVKHTDTIKIIHEDGYEEIRKVRQSAPKKLIGKQEIILF